MLSLTDCRTTDMWILQLYADSNSISVVTDALNPGYI